jgi:tetratricopeptide (TPR) repeat protein
MTENELMNLIDEGASFLGDGNYRKASELFNKILVSGDLSGIGHYGLGLIAFQQNEMNRAKSSFLHAIKDNPESTESLNMLGVILNLDGQYSEAVPYFQKAIDLQDDYIEAKRNLAETYLSLNEFEKAVTMWSQLLDSNAENIDVILRFADFYFENQDFEKCTVYLRRAQKIDPDIEEVQELLHRVEVLQGKKQDAE